MDSSDSISDATNTVAPTAPATVPIEDPASDLVSDAKTVAPPFTNESAIKNSLESTTTEPPSDLFSNSRATKIYRAKRL